MVDPGSRWKDPIPSWFWPVLLGGAVVGIGGVIVALDVNAWIGSALVVVGLVGSQIMVRRLARRDGLPRKGADTASEVAATPSVPPHIAEAKRAAERTGLVALSVLFGAALAFYGTVVVLNLSSGRGDGPLGWLLLLLSVAMAILLVRRWRAWSTRYRKSAK